MRSTGSAPGFSRATSRIGSTAPISSSWRILALLAGLRARARTAPPAERAAMIALDAVCQSLSDPRRAPDRARQRDASNFARRPQFRHPRRQRRRQVDPDPAARRLRDAGSRHDPPRRPGVVSARLWRHVSRRAVGPRECRFHRPGLRRRRADDNALCRGIRRARRIFRHAGQHLFGRHAGAARLRHLPRDRFRRLPDRRGHRDRRRAVSPQMRRRVSRAPAPLRHHPGRPTTARRSANIATAARSSPTAAAACSTIWRARSSATGLRRSPPDARRPPAPC